MIVPASLLGQTPSAILHTQGGVWVNGYEARDSSAIFTGDVLETKPGFSATLALDGSTVLIQPESVTKLEANLLVLDHGSVAVGSSRGFRVRVNCITVIPVVEEWTQYEVTDVNGTVHVGARKKDVNVDHQSVRQKSAPEPQQSRDASVHEGEEHNFNESDLCGVPAKPTEAGRTLNPKWIAAGGGAGGILIWLLLHGGGERTPMSKSTP